MRKTVHLDQEVSPDTMEDLEGDKQSVENIVGREELNEACSVVEGNLDPGLEQIDFSDYVVEEGHDLNAAVLVSFEFEEGR